MCIRCVRHRYGQCFTGSVGCAHSQFFNAYLSASLVSAFATFGAADDTFTATTRSTAKSPTKVTTGPVAAIPATTILATAAHATPTNAMAATSITSPTVSLRGPIEQPIWYRHSSKPFGFSVSHR